MPKRIVIKPLLRPNKLRKILKLLLLKIKKLRKMKKPPQQTKIP